MAGGSHHLVCVVLIMRSQWKTLIVLKSVINWLWNEVYPSSNLTWSWVDIWDPWASGWCRLLKIAMQCLGSFFLVQHISSFLDSWTYFAHFMCAQKCASYKEQWGTKQLWLFLGKTKPIRLFDQEFIMAASSIIGEAPNLSIVNWRVKIWTGNMKQEPI